MSTIMPAACVVAGDLVDLAGRGVTYRGVYVYSVNLDADGGAISLMCLYVGPDGSLDCAGFRIWPAQPVTVRTRTRAASDPGSDRGDSR